jgi:uncharacterized damage-inducible protein DinB
MKRIVLAMLCAAAPVLAAEGSMNPAERAYLLDQLESTKKAVLASIQGVSAAQWAFKPAPTVWSVKECAEHIILAEDFLFGTVQQILKAPAVPRPERSNEQVDHIIVERVQDRSQKATAPEPITPTGRFATPEDAAREFTARRDKTIAYAKSTDDPLRVHVAPSPAGAMDAYQFLLLLASHSARHTAQIREVQSNAGYPKAGTKGE